MQMIHLKKQIYEHKTVAGGGKNVEDLVLEDWIWRYGKESLSVGYFIELKLPFIQSNRH